jgi:hypothetical protein
VTRLGTLACALWLPFGGGNDCGMRIADCGLDRVEPRAFNPQSTIRNPPSPFTVARLHYDGGGDWYANPSSLPNLLAAVRERTGLSVAPRDRVVRLTDADLWDLPYLYMTGHGNVAFSATEVALLRRYLEQGGFLHADDNYGMDQAFRREIARVFPDHPLVEVPVDHAVYHLVTSSGGRTQDPARRERQVRRIPRAGWSCTTRTNGPGTLGGSRCRTARRGRRAVGVNLVAYAVGRRGAEPRAGGGRARPHVGPGCWACARAPARHCSRAPWACVRRTRRPPQLDRRLRRRPWRHGGGAAWADAARVVGWSGTAGARGSVRGLSWTWRSPAQASSTADRRAAAWSAGGGRGPAAGAIRGRRLPQARPPCSGLVFVAARPTSERAAGSEPLAGGRPAARRWLAWTA